ncbi:MAG: long-chain fatty acid--CoA ligase [Anaerolineaceae bacterium]|nr:long-chain fatty acid--CoA ligase [Anaerolineaceae bacterium]
MREMVWHQQYDMDVAHEITVPDQALSKFLETAAKISPKHPALRFHGMTIDYQSLDIMSDRLAMHLAAMGLQKGEAVGICLPNIPQFVILFYAILKAGGVVAALNPRYGEDEMRFLLNDVNVGILFTDTSTAPTLAKLEYQIPVHTIIYTSAADAPKLVEAVRCSVPFDEGVSDFVSLLEMSTVHPLPVVGADDRCIYQYSGGTTGIPKAATSLHRNLVANTLQFKEWLSTLWEGEERTLAAIPLYHVYGMVIAMSVSIALRSTIVLEDNPGDLERLLFTIEKEQITLFPAVPFLLQAILRHPRVEQHQAILNSIKAVISGAAPLKMGIKEAVDRLIGGTLVEGYGLSEAPTATHCSPLQGEYRPGSIGLPLPGVEAKIVSLEDELTPLAPGEAGELVLRGPQVMQEYHQKPEETANTLRNGWLYTGDIARMDENGFFYLVDRKKDLIKVGGFQVWPREVEDVLIRHPHVRDAGVIGVMEEDHNEFVKAWVVLDEGEAILEDELIAWCKRWIAAYKAPREIVFCDALPRSAVGKLLRKELRVWQAGQPKQS